MQGTFLFLGTSASAGVPQIGCKCEICSSKSKFDKRLRPAGLLHVGGKSLLIDAGPDLRQQLLKSDVTHLDGLLLTHTHFDHIAGIDELRIFYVITGRRFPCLLSKESYEELRTRYHYFFEKKGTSLSAQFNVQILEGDRGETEFLGVKFKYFSYFQGGMKVHAFRLGNFAYVTDIRDYPESVFEDLEGVETLVLSALRKEPSNVHFNFEEAVAFARRAGAKKTWLTHLSHFHTCEEGNSLLPEDVRLAYDGLQLEFKCTK